METELTEVQKQECILLTEEYKRINDEILKRIDYCDKNINYQFILLGIVATAITALSSSQILGNRLIRIEYVLLIAPIIFNLLGFYYSINNMYTFKISQYITKHIKPRMIDLLKTQFVLGYDDYIQLEVFKKAKKSNKTVTLIVLQWTTSIPIILLCSYLFVKFSTPYTIKLNLQAVLLVINAILMGISFKINSDQYKALFSGAKGTANKSSPQLF